MQNSTPLVSIIVLAHDKVEFTERCVSSILETSYPGLEFIFVNNGSSDNTGKLFEETSLTVWKHQGWMAQCINFEKNVGAVEGRNEALEKCRGDYIVFLDNDIVVTDHEWVSKMVTRMEADQAIGVLGPKLLFPKPDYMIQCAGCTVTKRGQVFFNGRGSDGRLPEFCKEKEVQALISACWIMRKEAMRKVGPLEMVYHPVQFEDIDYCYKIREAGYKALYFPEVTVFHYENVTTDDTKGINYKYVTIKNGIEFKKRWRHMYKQENGPRDEEMEWLDLPKVSWQDIKSQSLAPIGEDTVALPSATGASDLEDANNIDSEVDAQTNEPEVISEEEIQVKDVSALDGSQNNNVNSQVVKSEEPSQDSIRVTEMTAEEPDSKQVDYSLLDTPTPSADRPRTELHKDKILTDIPSSNSPELNQAPDNASLRPKNLTIKVLFVLAVAVGIYLISISRKNNDSDPASLNEPDSGSLALTPDEKDEPSEISSGSTNGDTETQAPVNSATSTVAEVSTNYWKPRPGVPIIKQKITGLLADANIVIYLKSRILLVRSGTSIARVYRDIAVAGSDGRKSLAGDGKNPLGLYRICLKNSDGSLTINYPNDKDAETARQKQLISEQEYREIKQAWVAKTCPPWTTRLGGNIRIKGNRSSRTSTAGGFAIGIDHMEELSSIIPLNTPVLLIDK